MNKMYTLLVGVAYVFRKPGVCLPRIGPAFLITMLIVFLLGPALGAQAIEGSGTTETNSGSPPADTVAELQSFDTFSSLEDGQPGDPGSFEFVLPLAYTSQSKNEQSWASEPELKYTMDGNAFLRSMKFFMTVGIERTHVIESDSSSQTDYNAMQLGRLSANPAGSFDPLNELLKYQLAKSYIGDLYPEASSNWAWYALGRKLTGASPAVAQPIDTFSNLLQAPFPVATADDLIRYQLTRLLIKPKELDQLNADNRLQLQQNSTTQESDLNLGWSQRWFVEQPDRSLWPTFATVVEYSDPLTNRTDRGQQGTLTLVFSRFLGPGTIYLNLIGSAVVNQGDPELKDQYYAERIGYQWNLDGDHLALTTAIVHAESEVRRAESATTAELALKFKTDADITIGPGIAWGIDGRQSTPRISLGLTLTF
ncbi:MAG: hypothetical protein KDK39_10080 [Leptospiraceae bacterium]|nr:hypothetical protein [Leptospiraceae bacterium]